MLDSELVNGGILKQAQLRICDTAARNDLDIDLRPLSRIGHLFVRLWSVVILWCLLRKHSHFAHDAEQTFRSAGIAALLEPVPQFHHTKIGVSAPHIPNHLEFIFGMLVGMTVRTPGLATQGFHTTVPARLPEVNV